MNSQLFASAVTMPILMFKVLEDDWTNNPVDAHKTFRKANSDVR
jgi:hypothetical protein